MISAVDYGYKPQPSLFVCSETRHPHLAPGALGGHTVSNKGYSPDCHINLHAVFYLEKKRGCVWGGGGARTPQDPSPQLFFYTHNASV